MLLSRINKIKQEEGLSGVFRRFYKRTLEPFFLSIDVLYSKLLAPIYQNGFHKLFYYRFFEKSPYEKKIFWLGKEISKLPLDSWVYQEIIWECRPDVIVECGTDKGGSAYFFASIFDLVGSGEIITIDVNDTKVDHPRVKKVQGSSVAADVFEEVKNMISGKKVMVVLDSDHTKSHVLKEMELYCNLVTVGQYMVVEDSNLNWHPVRPFWGPGPMEAIKSFLRNNDNFKIDFSKEKFLVTFFPNGFLKKVK